MWNLLVDFSTKSLFNLFSKNKDLPMVNLIKRLQKKDYAKSVYVFTSHYTFGITLQSEYKSNPKDSVLITYESRNNSFLIVYYNVKLNLSQNYRCSEMQSESLVDAFVLRMFLTEMNEFLKFEIEESPLFQIGQSVEVIQDDYSHKYHRGVIYKIEKHNKQNRYMYFIEEDGKKLKKRYFTGNLRTIEE